MAKKTPLLKNGKLYIWDEYQKRYVVNGVDISDPGEWKYWLEFLKKENSLRVIHTNKQGFKFSYSVYKIKHREEGHGWQWIAHKRKNKQLRRKYIGKNSNMTVKRLAEVAEEISQGKIPIK